MTRVYEAMFIFKPGVSDQDLAQSAAKVEEPIQKLGGRVESSKGWGRRRLAFRIRKQSEGHYHVVRFEAPTDGVVELGRLFRLNESILRFVILNGEEVAASSNAREAGA